jgi:acetyl esterase/lipase
VEDRSVLDRPARLPDLALSNADVYFGERSRPVVVLLHGGFWRPEWDRTHLRPMASSLADVGWPVFVPEFRRIPGDPLATVADVSAAVAAVGGDVILMGHSAGGHLAMWAASRFKARGTIALAPAADLTLARELGLDDHAVDDFLGAHALAPFQPVTEDAVIIHGTEDTTVPISVSEAYVSAHPKVRMVVLPGEGHFALIDPLSRAWPNVIDQLNRLLA